MDHLTINQAKNELEKLENELEVYLSKKKLNFLKTQPASPKLKEIVISKTNEVFDKFTHYIIKDEEIDTKIYGLQEAIASYQNYIVKEMKRLSKYKGSDLVRYYRDEEHKKWEEISRLTNYSIRQCHYLYKK